VTVLYEVVPVGVALPKDVAGDDGRPVVDPLTYQTDRRPSGGRAELMTVKIRYKRPAEDVSTLLTQAVRADTDARGDRRAAANALPFAAAVAEFGLLLRDPEVDVARWTRLAEQVKALPVSGEDAADRQGLVDLVELAAGLRKLR
jgi:Ca-activated chloride channel family protein